MIALQFSAPSTFCDLVMLCTNQPREIKEITNVSHDVWVQ